LRNSKYVCAPLRRAVLRLQARLVRSVALTPLAALGCAPTRSLVKHFAQCLAQMDEEVLRLY
jgi:hypothetical protein